MKNRSLRFKINIAIFTTCLVIAIIFGAILYPFEIRRHDSHVKKVKLLLDKLEEKKRFHFYETPIKVGGRDFIVSIPANHKQEALAEEDYAILAEEHDCEEAIVKAIIEVESTGSGFLLQEPPPARPKRRCRRSEKPFSLPKRA